MSDKLDFTKIENDEVHRVDVYLDCGSYWKPVYPKLPTTLHDIYLKYSSAQMIYVIVDGFMDGVIYRCGNYGEGVWQQYATTQGMA